MADFSLEQARQHRLFTGLDDEDWAELLIHLQPQPFQAADIIFAEGDPSQGLYLLLSGQVELRRPYTRFGGDYQLALLQPGHLFGEGELLVQRRRSHTAVCLSTVAVAVLSQLTLQRLPAAIQLTLLRAWGSILSEQLYWRDQIMADLLEQQGSQIAASRMAELHQQDRR